jgi:hypothetical protein
VEFQQKGKRNVELRTNVLKPLLVEDNVEVARREAELVIILGLSRHTFLCKWRSVCKPIMETNTKMKLHERAGKGRRRLLQNISRAFVCRRVENPEGIESHCDLCQEMRRWRGGGQKRLWRNIRCTTWNAAAR